MAEISIAISICSFLFGSGVLVSFYKSLKGIKMLKLGMQAMLRDRLLQGHKYYKDKGYMSYQEMANMINMYDMYHSLGANGVMDEVIEEIRNIPIK